VGAQGIRRRKRWRKLPPAEGISQGDVDRLFGRFRWGAYSPAGNLERNGFFWRQFKRRLNEGETVPEMVEETVRWIHPMAYVCGAVVVFGLAAFFYVLR